MKMDKDGYYGSWAVVEEAVRSLKRDVETRTKESGEVMVGPPFMVIVCRSLRVSRFTTS